jgi:hypothetical protein
MWGCGGGAVSTIRTRAAGDMACPVKNVEVTSTDHANPDNDTGGAYYAEGCNKIHRYTTQCDNAGCHDVHGVDVVAMVENQASSDLQCSANTLLIVHLNEVDKFAVLGCKRQVNYRVQCDGSECRLTTPSL